MMAEAVESRASGAAGGEGESPSSAAARKDERGASEESHASDEKREETEDDDVETMCVLFLCLCLKCWQVSCGGAASRHAARDESLVSCHVGLRDVA